MSSIRTNVSEGLKQQKAEQEAHFQRHIKDTVENINNDCSERIRAAEQNEKEAKAEAVMTALGFFSTAYTLSFRPHRLDAARDARTRGPRPATGASALIFPVCAQLLTRNGRTRRAASRSRCSSRVGTTRRGSAR